MKRTHLPLNGLRVFDAAARHLSFTRAADELAVTPAAVGQQVRALEDTLGTVLFRRTAKGLELTAEGEAGLSALREGFLQFEEAVRAMQAGQTSKHLAIAAPREVQAKWLMPRLATIAASDPDLRFAVSVIDGAPDFAEANLDLAICWGEGPGALEGEALESEGMVLVAHPERREGPSILWPGCPGDGEAGLRVGDAALALDAVAAGLGRASVPELVARADIVAGRVVVIGEPRFGRHGYWLVAPTPQWRQKKVQALVEALAS